MFRMSGNSSPPASTWPRGLKKRIANPIPTVVMPESSNSCESEINYQISFCFDLGFISMSLYSNIRVKFWCFLSIWCYLLRLLTHIVINWCWSPSIASESFCNFWSFTANWCSIPPKYSVTWFIFFEQLKSRKVKFSSSWLARWLAGLVDGIHLYCFPFLYECYPFSSLNMDSKPCLFPAELLMENNVLILLSWFWRWEILVLGRNVSLFFVRIPRLLLESLIGSLDRGIDFRLDLFLKEIT